MHTNMSSAKRRLVRNDQSIFTPLFSQFNLLNMLSSFAVNSLGEMSYSSLDPDFLTPFVHVLSLSCPYICISGFLCTHLLFLVLAMMSTLLGFVRGQMPYRNPRTQHTVECCIRGTSL